MYSIPKNLYAWYSPTMRWSRPTGAVPMASSTSALVRKLDTLLLKNHATYIVAYIPGCCPSVKTQNTWSTCAGGVRVTDDAGAADDTALPVPSGQGAGVAECTVLLDRWGVVSSCCVEPEPKIRIAGCSGPVPVTLVAHGGIMAPVTLLVKYVDPVMGFLRASVACTWLFHTRTALRLSLKPWWLFPELPLMRVFTVPLSINQPCT